KGARILGKLISQGLGHEKRKLQSANEFKIGKSSAELAQLSGRLLRCAHSCNRWLKLTPHEQSLSQRYRRPHRPVARQHDDCCGWIRSVRHTGESHRRTARQRREGPHHRGKQRGRRWFRYGGFAHYTTGEKGHGLVRGREQRVRAPGAQRRTRT